MPTDGDAYRRVLSFGVARQNTECRNILWSNLFLLKAL